MDLGHGRTESTARDEQPVGRNSNQYWSEENNEYLKTSVRTSNDINFFSLAALVCRDETER